MRVVKFTKPFYLISDTHFFHSRLAFDFGLRTNFKSIEEMNETIFSNWNNTISEDDYVFFLGDFVVGAENKYKTAQVIYDSLNGKKIFLRGNHDEHLKESTTIPVIDGPMEIIYNGFRILLNHEPIFSFDQDVMICGHIHNNEVNETLKSNMYNVSVEMIDYKPQFIDTILESIQV